MQQDVSADEGLPRLQGQDAPSFTLVDLDGKKVSLSQYRGKAVLINFWATWCAPCKIEMPWFVALHKQYAPDGFEILGVSEDDPSVTRAQLVKFGQEQSARLTIIGRDGKVVAETAGLISRSEVEANIKKALAAGGKRAN